MSAAVLIVAVLWAFVMGCFLGAARVHRAVFNPWMKSLHSMQPGDPDYWVRGRDYDAAWYASVRVQFMGSSFEPHSFSEPLPHVRRGAA